MLLWLNQQRQQNEKKNREVRMYTVVRIASFLKLQRARNKSKYSSNYECQLWKKKSLCISSVMVSPNYFTVTVTYYIQTLLCVRCN